MREDEKVLVLDKYELGIVINALNQFRNQLIREKRINPHNSVKKSIIFDVKRR